MKDETIGYIFLALVILGLSGFLYYQNRAPDGPPPRWTGPIDPLPSLEELDIAMAKVTIGRRLYHDGALSGDGTVSCASCHGVADGGAEARRTSFGVGGAVGPINAPTTLNTWNHIAQFWDGRAADLQEQAGGPVENPLEMAADFAYVVPRIAEDPWYAAQFAAVYPEGVSKESITDAIAEYERSLITPGPFDAWHAGDETAMSEEAIAGYRTFVEVGCTSCHQGAGLGGTMFQKMGVVHDYFERRGGELTDADLGRFNHTGEEAHRHHFKVPTLRNVALTGPYFHDGSEDDLGAAVETMAYVQLGQELDETQTTQIVAFLEALTGELPAYVMPPADEMPPERSYPLPPAYDLRLSKQMVEGAPVYFLRGQVTEENKEALVAQVTAKVGAVNADGLMTNPNAGDALPEGFDGVVDQVLTNLAEMAQGRCDFDFGDEGTEVTLVVEGTNDAPLMSELPPGYSWATPATRYDYQAAVDCDARLAQLQGETRLSFRTGSAALSEESERMLAQVPSLLGGCPDNVRLHVAGHTDNVGDPGANLRLSRQRAMSVVDALVRAGVGPSRVFSHGYGETQPMADNAEEAGRALNRRIELALFREF